MTNAKKSFGQHFLTDPHKADGLVDALKINPGDAVIEIGPGTGILTKRILQRQADLVAIELDRDMVKYLNNQFHDNERFRLIEDDIIKVNLRAIAPAEGIKVIGNLPYNISGAIVEWLIEYNDIIDLAVITVQKEVASRLKSAAGSRDYGSLSVMVQSFFDVKRLFDLSPGCFSPKPKVYSTALLFLPAKKIGDNVDYAEFRDFLRACFSQKRKKLVNSLQTRSLEWRKRLTREQVENYLARLGKKSDIRAEQLKLKDFLELYDMTRE